ncbi:hypothetical protein [Peribacillus sp. SCS-155]|uniref:hypothetical protein n=1 Tax=Peribacillus sedimenti TaxID=3115297 RepID=UPI003905D208
MICFCEHQETYDLKVEGDVGTDPIWCNQCGCNFDIEEVPISGDLKEELMRWAMRYGEWMDWNNDTLRVNGIELEDKHNKLGQQLTEKVKKELGKNYKVRFSPSSSARMYADLNCMEYPEELKQSFRYKNFGEVAIDSIISRIMTDVEEFIFNNGKTIIDKHTKEFISDWMESFHLSKDCWKIITEREKDFIKDTIEESLGAMPVWKNDKEFQAKVLDGFKQFFGEDSDFYIMFRNAYLKGLEEEYL